MNSKEKNDYEKQRFENLCLKYDEWRQGEINSENFNERCVPLDSIFSLKARYALPKISDLDTSYYDGKEIDTSSFLLNNDTIPDYLFCILPRDCENGNGVFSQHPPIYLLMLSDNNNYKIDNSIIKNVENTLNNFFNTLNGFYADRVFFEKIYNQEGENMLDGNFNVWLKDDASCCPSLEAKFKTYLPSTSNGYIEIKGTIVTDRDLELKEQFEKRLTIIQ